MQASTHTWEPALISLAHEALRVQYKTADVPAHDQQSLDDAYEYCAALTSRHSKSFHLASALLPRMQRMAARALYAFCRVTDDIVDCAEEGAAADLADWRLRATSSVPPEGDPVLLAWTDARIRHEIPLHYAEQLIDGVAQDLHKTRYNTFDELATYCYSVASTVGLMSMHIIGFASQDAIPYAIKLGVALQLTNILRDIGEDWRRGRVYLPVDELQSFGLSPSNIASGRVTAEWREFMKFQIARNRQLYEEALPGISYLNRNGRFAIAAAANLYRAILDDIEANDYDVFTRRAHVTTVGKLVKLPATWWTARRIALPQ